MARIGEFFRKYRTPAAVAAAVLVCCAAAGIWLGVRASAQPATSLQTLFLDYQDYLLARPGVVSVGIGERNGRSYIQVYVRRLTPQVKAGIPRKLAGWPVSVKVVKVKTPHPKSPKPVVSSTPTRVGQMSIDVSGTVTAVVALAQPAANQPLGWLLIQRAGGSEISPDLVSIAVVRQTVFYQRTGDKLAPLTDTTFGHELRGRTIEVGYSGPARQGQLPQVTAAAVVLVD